jgi:predicted AAA+ superfamily ATPase
MFVRQQCAILKKRLEEPRKFIQILSGPRQVGKTTIARQVMESLKAPSHYASADEPSLNHHVWLEQQWDIARLKIKQGAKSVALFLDEIQKIPQWSGIVKKLWDDDSAAAGAIKVVILGSAPLLIQKGLTESLAGRFEKIPVPHWSYSEMNKAFEFDLSRYIYFGGYPGAASLTEDEPRWKNYITNSLIETTISRDILLMTRVDKPALLRRLFHLGCEYSGQIKRCSDSYRMPATLPLWHIIWSFFQARA